jgi:hypothetical protein
MTLTLRLLAIIALTCAPTMLFGQAPPNSATVPTSCSKSLWEETLTKSPIETWNEEAGYIVAARKENGGARKSYYYAADSLRLNQQMIGSILGTPAAPVSGLKHVTFDARVIEVDERLVFDTAEVTLIADTIIFHQAGAIILTGAPQDDGDGVTLIARSIDFRDGAIHPFQFVTADKDWHPSSARAIEIVSPSIQLRNGVATTTTIRDLTLDPEYLEIATGADPLRPYVLNISPQKAQEAYTQIFNSQMRWPEQTATKLSRMFALAPFDKDNLTFIQGQLTTYSTQWKSSDQRVAIATLARLQAAIDAGQDQLGFTKFEVPRRTFISELSQFKGR